MTPITATEPLVTTFRFVVAKGAVAAIGGTGNGCITCSERKKKYYENGTLVLGYMGEEKDEESIKLDIQMDILNILTEFPNDTLKPL